MAIENAKTLNVRIKNKYDSYENWVASNLVLEAGEIAIAYTTVDVKVDNGTAKHPALLMKVGNGTDTFANLPWMSARAADVLSVCKDETALTEFVNNVIADAGIASNDAMEALAKRVTDTEDAIEVLNGAADVEGSVAKAIADAIAALNLADTYAAKEHGHEIADVEGLADALADKVAKEDGKSLVADTEIARLADMSDGANKVEASETNGNIKIDGVETVVYTHPAEHAISEIAGLADALAGLQAKGDYAAEEHTHEMDEVNGLADALAGKETAGEAKKVQDALDEYKADNDAAVKENTDAIAAIKDHESVDSFADVMAEIAKKQDIIPENTYDAYGAAAAEKERAEGVESDLQDAIDAINNAENGILKQAKDYADGKDEAIAAAQKAGDDAMAEAEKKVASVTAGDASVAVAGTSTAPTVAVKLDPAADNAIKLGENGLKVEIGAAPEYSIVKAADSGDYAAVYNLTKDGAIVGASINIPKDMVVKSGSVVNDEIVLVLNDAAATEIKIPVASLIEYVTSGSATGDMVVVNVSDDHKVTATITDGTITLAKLTTEVQTAIGKAHSHENATVLAGITADDVENWNGAQAAAEATAAGALASAKSELEGKIAAAQTAAEKVANDNNAAMNTRVEALEAIDHEHANKDLLDTYTQTEENLADAVAKKHAHANAAELDKIADGDKAKWDAAAAKAHEHANADELAKFVDGDKAKLDSAVQTVTATADSGLKATRTGNDIAIEIDDTITFVFDCGTSAV